MFKKISTLSNNFTPPPGACNTYRAFYAKLEEFEQDLHQHVHLENNILFPKAIALGKEFSLREAGKKV
ncbi:hemerythrin domain-containing protein [Antarcticibacterium sp. 1MA-6-2]|uniref:hemerythrin domain-containing protein n=1 Tax=Antarcticibacterium sp. 1MA-6-2 TaxID=2908210 RepID=UPI0028834F85|nr:hemerythrin domain-containing protein [Antarcticibacterium sp. 1MA-6-2]